MIKEPLEMSQDFIGDMKREGYEHLRMINVWGLCGLFRFIFTAGLCALSPERIVQRWCYNSYNEALQALQTWDGQGDPPGEWIKSKGIHGEYANPNNSESTL